MYRWHCGFYIVTFLSIVLSHDAEVFMIKLDLKNYLQGMSERTALLP